MDNEQELTAICEMIFQQSHLNIHKVTPGSSFKDHFQETITEMKAPDHEEFWNKIKLIPAHEIHKIQQEVMHNTTPGPSVYRKQIGTWEDLKIMIVNGDEVKMNHDMDFVEGGNDQVYHLYVPQGEIWVDAIIDTHDVKFVALHEIVERFYMKHHNLPYAKAHNIANEHENQKRAETFSEK